MTISQPILVAVWSKGWVCCRSFDGIAGSNPAKGVDVSLVSVVCCKIEVHATGRSLVQRSHAVCRMSECDQVCQ